MVPDCPPVFFNLAIECCRMDPDRRQDDLLLILIRIQQVDILPSKNQALCNLRLRDTYLLP